MLETIFQILFQNYTVLYFILFYFIFFLVSWGVVRLSRLGTSATNWPILPAPDDDDDERGMRIGREIEIL
jgi:hypothetical protein